MCMGVHQEELAKALSEGDEIFIYQSPKVAWDVKSAFSMLGNKVTILMDTQHIIDKIVETAKPEDHILVMSNGGFDNIHHRLLEALSKETLTT
jgi:UDP-N-acetylmuramate: L-alanyl-gamma-D-glutamyl-meso-diaminopimelate ligase